MPVNGQVHKLDIGTVFRATIKDGDGVVVDVSGASTKTLYFRKPDGTVLTKSASFTTSGTDGKIQWTTIANDLDTVGDWVVQGYVVLASGTWHSSVYQFKVVGNVA